MCESKVYVVMAMKLWENLEIAPIGRPLAGRLMGSAGFLLVFDTLDAAMAASVVGQDIVTMHVKNNSGA